MTTISLPSFYEDPTTDNGKETMLDYNLNWLLNCANPKYAQANVKIHTYARNFVLALIYGKPSKDGYNLNLEAYNDYQVKSVNTWRQWNQIDLIAEIEIQSSNALHRFVVVIENKMYTTMSNGQLEKYKTIVNDFYKDKDYEPVFLFIKAEEVNDDEIEKCVECQYKWMTFYDIIDCSQIEETGNYLFDEFWIRYW